MNIQKNMFDLAGKNAIVVGGAGGIGQAIAQGLAMYGVHRQPQGGEPPAGAGGDQGR